MIKYIVFMVSIFASLYSNELKYPIATFTSSGYVIDLMYKDSKIYSSTDAGTVDIFDFKTKKIIKKITVDKIQDFMGDLIDSKIFSVDEINGSIMILSQDKKGFSRIYIHKNGKNRPIIDYTNKLSIIKARYLDSNTLLLALLSNEIISYDISRLKQNYRIQVSGAKFSDFCLNEDRSKVVIADESGELQIHDTKSGINIRTLKGQNLDNVFQISYKNGIIATAGQDRKVGIYAPKFNSSYNKRSKFLVYSVGLSPSGKIAAYSSDEKNNVSVFNTISKSSLGKFGGNKITLSNIVFIDENSFLVSSNSKTINLYKIGGK